jgi:carboxymethylenebutenolidase
MKKLLTVILSMYSAFFSNAQDFAVKQLENSPRHQEWVKVASGERKINCFVVYPEVSVKVPVVIVIHENMGLTDWVRSFADQLAAAGFIAVAPDLLSDFSLAKTKTSDFSSVDEARNAIYQLNPDQIKNDLNSVNAYVSKITSGNGKTIAIGFCWGGGQCFRFATYNSSIKAALVFYGISPDNKEDIDKISIPVYGFYGGNDERIDAGIPATDSIMKICGKKYDYKIYQGAGHGFMRQGDDPSGLVENKKARDESWERLKKIISSI